MHPLFQMYVHLISAFIFQSMTYLLYLLKQITHVIYHFKGARLYNKHLLHKFPIKLFI